MSIAYNKARDSGGGKTNRPRAESGTSQRKRSGSVVAALGYKILGMNIRPVLAG